MLSGYCSQRCVLPSMSVKRKVTVPVGGVDMGVPRGASGYMLLPSVNGPGCQYGHGQYHSPMAPLGEIRHVLVILPPSGAGISTTEPTLYSLPSNKHVNRPARSPEGVGAAAARPLIP